MLIYAQRGLISDLKKAATCDVTRVCRLSCSNCPYIIENIDTKKIKIGGLSSYTIKLQKGADEQLLILISAENIDNWLIENNLPFKTLTAELSQQL